jgi:hypothetical protein
MNHEWCHPKGFFLREIVHCPCAKLTSMVRELKATIRPARPVEPNAPLEFREDDGAKTESASQRLIELL